MLRTTLGNVGIQRTIQPLYAQHQATPYGGYLDASWNKSVDIYPGMVMTKLAGESFTLFTGASGQVPFGLAALFCAPTLGIDETANSSANLFTVWIGGSDAVFNVLAPAFAASATWTNPTDGSVVPLHTTKTGHTNGPGKLTNEGSGTYVDGTKVGELIQVNGTTSITVRLKAY